MKRSWAWQSYVRAVIVVLVVAVVVRYEAIGFSRLSLLASGADRAHVEMGLGWGDVLLRDLPKARRMLHGHFFADPHYDGEVHWYPFLTPLIAATVAKLTHWSVGRAYQGTSLLLMGAGLIALGVLFGVLLGRIGLIFLAVCLLTKKIEPLPACLYPVNAAQFALLLQLAASCALLRAAGERRFHDAKRVAVALGATLGLLVLLHGASFCCALAVCTAVLAYVAGRALDSERGRLRLLLQIGACLCIPVVALAALLFGPQLIHYGRVVRPEVARLWLNAGVYHDGNDLPSLVHLALFPRREALEGAILAVPLLWKARWRRTLLPFAVGIACAALQAHLGFVLHDAAHPRLAAFARTLQFAPPHTFISLMGFLITLSRLVVVGALLTMLLRFVRTRATKRWPRFTSFEEVASLVALTATLIALFVRSPGVYWLGYEPWSHELTSFAAEAATKTSGTNVYMVNDYSLAWLAEVSPLFFPYEVEANPYVEEDRRQATQQLVAAVGRGDDTTADVLLDKYRVSAFFAGGAGQDAVMRRCAGTVIAKGPGALRLYSRRRCANPQ